MFDHILSSGMSSNQIIFLCTSSSMTHLLKIPPHAQTHTHTHSSQPRALTCTLCMHCTLRPVTSLKRTGQNRNQTLNQNRFNPVAYQAIICINLKMNWQAFSLTGKAICTSWELIIAHFKTPRLTCSHRVGNSSSSSRW